jgi:flagellar protein FliO/FliZ
MGSSLFPLIILIALIAAAPWLARQMRQRFLVKGQAEPDAVRLISVLAVGPQQRIATVEIGSRYGGAVLVLGVTGQSINCLHVMSQGAVHSADGESALTAPSFSRELGRSVHGQ